MRGWSFPMGRWFGVDVRIHAFFLLLTGPCMLGATAVNLSIWRGMMLWILLLAAVTVREAVRVLGAAYFGLQIRNILLLPTGGLYAYANPESTERASSPKVQTPMAMLGPLANLSFGLIVAGLIAGSTSQVSLLEFPWITTAHLMRSAVWVNIFLGLINLVPAYPLDGGRILLGEFKRSREAAQASRSAAGISQVLAVLIFAAGIALRTPWLVMAGFFIFIGGQLEDQGTLFQSVVDNVRMKDVMLTDFSTMSPSDTLEDALYKTIHSLQDDFPVVRGVNLVGIVSRQSILDALRADGNGYVQGVMSRAFQVAQPEDSLGAMIRRMTAGRGLSLMPVTEGERIVGIVTLQNLMHSMGLLAEHRKLQRQR
ncbi:SREBP protease/CBS domain [Acidisarcina polymorpha]|uniref:SREBP protease/CBS domain n=1 Tax=Acidisarcina polymorpha TaxID=2211140 RepID=A0A2Z5FWP3_9BACT|nr:CBS domain-containing protein [Acidisarcina polymorpha]AXC10805.1 SREBP protease/CBS domain [Acidisarcina polymorpha]